ncbi:YbdK family carboxylate-amine ligase [Roseiconus nitratireducens]|uniref:Putative glutamate--cysteine ligase 2 n=1 Tax=Roseiconus nitratireducens TaxID=2605748 RepID=A0A5M6D1V3_9BACT|nr:glutamate--cysteine ligase [Roseiconus nitratireducens]KAA5539105.1 YbdK family carboxylate-amine ligase [Roseiconus nitratireducens]
MSDPLPVGIEEEYQLVDPSTGELRANCKDVMRNVRRDCGAEIQHELHLNQIEMASPVCQTLDDVREQLRQTRSVLAQAAADSGDALAAAGTNPLPVPEDPNITPKQRYRHMTERYQLIARDLLIFGCHVHVSMPDRGLGLQVMNRSRRWLPLLQAMTANSPYWDGEDTGYASYRHELWTQWPMAGAPPEFKDIDDYRQCVAALVSSGAIADESHIYWDIRLPTKVPTIEFRGADVMTSAEDAVAYVGLVRAIVMTALEDIRREAAAEPVQSTVLSYAIWHAARYGLAETLVDPVSNEQLPAEACCRALLDRLRPALQLAGDEAVVEAFFDRCLRQGTGADRQRNVFNGNLSEVVRHVVDQTLAESPAPTP